MKFRTTHIIFFTVQALAVWLFYRDFIGAAWTGVFPSAVTPGQKNSLVFERKETLPLSRSPSEYYLYSDGVYKYASLAPISSDSQYRFVTKQISPKEEIRLLLPLELGTLFFFRTLGFFVIAIVSGTFIYGISIKLQARAEPNKSS